MLKPDHWKHELILDDIDAFDPSICSRVMDRASAVICGFEDSEYVVVAGFTLLPGKSVGKVDVFDLVFFDVRGVIAASEKEKGAKQKSSHQGASRKVCRVFLKPV